MTWNIYSEHADLIHTVSFQDSLYKAGSENPALHILNVGGINSSDSQFRSIFPGNNRERDFCLYWLKLTPKKLQLWDKVDSKCKITVLFHFQFLRVPELLVLRLYEWQATTGRSYLAHVWQMHKAGQVVRKWGKVSLQGGAQVASREPPLSSLFALFGLFHHNEMLGLLWLEKQ